MWALAISADGKRVLSGSLDASVRLWEANSGLEVRRFLGHVGPVKAVAFSPDGRSVLSSGLDKTIRMWDIASGREVWRATLDSLINSLAFSPEGRTFLSGSDDAFPRLWDTVNGRMLRQYQRHKRPISSIVFSHNGRFFIAGSWDRTISLWETVSSKKVREFSGHTGEVTSVAFSSDDTKLASGSSDKTARIWDVANGSQLRVFEGHTNLVNAVAFVPGHSTLFSGSEDGTARLWDLASGSEILQIKTPYGVSSIAVSSDGKTAVTASWDAKLRQWDLNNGNEMHQMGRPSSAVSAIALSADRKTLFSAKINETMHVWDLATGSERFRFENHDHFVQAAAVSPDGHTLLTGGMDKQLRLWDAKTGLELHRLKGHSSAINAVAYSPDGKVFVSGSSDGTMRLWDSDSGRELRSVAVNTGRVLGVGFDLDGTSLTSETDDGSLRRWEANSGRELRTGNIPTTEFPALTFNLNGSSVAPQSGRHLAHLQNIPESVAVRQRNRLTGGITSAAYSADGKTLVQGNLDGSTKLWRVRDGAELATLISFTDGSWAVTEPGGRYDSSSNGENPNLHWVVGLTPIGIEQLKERYYDPGLLAKIMGVNKEPLRTVPAFEAAVVKLPPTVELSQVPSSSSSTTALARLTDEGGGIGRVRVRLNGKELRADASAQLRPPPDGKALELRIALPADRLLPGANTLDVLAFNADNHIQSRLVSLSVHGPDAAGRGAVRADAPVQPGAAPSGPPPTLFVIAAGVSQYAASDQRLNLQFAGKDAADLTQALLLGGQRLFGVGKVQAQLLTDAPTDSLKAAIAAQGAGNTVQIAAPTRAALQAAFARMAQQTKPEDILVVTLAGHGVMTPGSGLDTGDYHYLTREAQSTDLSDPTVRQLWGVSSAELTEWTKAIKANKQVLVLDTCAAGGAVDKLISQRNLPGSHTIALERLKDRTGFHILAGAAADRVSYEASRYGQGLLTYALLSGLRGAALREGEFADISTLFQYAVDEVPKLAKSIGGVQRPLVASPRGSSFDIGRLTAEDKMQVPLAQIRPLILRAEIQSEDFKDTLRLQTRLNAYLREQNQSTASGALMFVDADEHPDGWKLRARYRRQGDGYLLEGVLFQGEAEKGLVRVELMAEEAGQVGELMAAVKSKLQKE